MTCFAFRYGNLEMSNLSVVVIAAAGVLSMVFFVIASLNTDTQGLIDSAVQKFDDDNPSKPRSGHTVYVYGYGLSEEILR